MTAFEYAPAPESRAIARLRPSYGIFVDGQFRDGRGEAVKTINPATEEPLAEVAEANEADVADAVAAARRASWLALLAGGDFIKTSTGKVSPAATPPVALVMLQAVRDFAARTGHVRGVKLAGGIRTSKEAVRYLVMVNEVAGQRWLDPRTFRFGASSLLNDLLQQRHKLTTGAYDGPDYVSID